MAKEYFIRIGDQQVPVSEEVYRAFKRPAWAERKRRKVRADMERSLDVFLADGFDIPSNEALVDEIVADKLLLDMLLAALAELTDDERSLIDALFYQEKSEREVAGETGRSKGDAVLQKTFCVDFLTKKMKPNEGEVPQYYVENSHPAIISPEVFGLVQAEIKRRKPLGRCVSSTHYFSSKIICGECGSAYGSKVWHSNSKYRRVVWQCNHKYKKKGCKCGTPHLTEDTLRAAFVEAFNRFIENKERFIEDYNIIIETLTDTSALDNEAAELEEECTVVMELIRKAVEDNARYVQDQEEYQKRNDALIARYDTAKNRLDEVADEKLERNCTRESIAKVLEYLKERNCLLTEFDEEIWYMTIESVTVHSEKKVTFTFKTGTEMDVDVRGK